MNKRRLLGDAKEALLGLAASGIQSAGRSEKISVTGRRGVWAADGTGAKKAPRRRGKWTAYDVEMAETLARILSGGGRGAAAGLVPEERLFELEREVFVELCGKTQTQERIRHMLATGKPLRN